MSYSNLVLEHPQNLGASALGCGKSGSDSKLAGWAQKVSLRGRSGKEENELRAQGRRGLPGGGSARSLECRMARKGRGSNDQGKSRDSPAGPGTWLKSKEDGGSNGVWAVKVGGGSLGTLFCER